MDVMNTAINAMHSTLYYVHIYPPPPFLPVLMASIRVPDQSHCAQSAMRDAA